MAIIQRDRGEELEEAAQERDFWAQERVAKRDHEYRLARARYITKTRHQVWVSFAKMPVLVVLAMTIPFLVLLKREVPETLLSFFDL